MDTLVLWAVRLSSVDILEDLIETGGANVNGSYGPNEDTLLHIAVKTLWTSGCVTLRCIMHQPTVIRLLLRSGARVDALNRSGASALHLLCLHLSDRRPGTSCEQVLPGMKILDLLLEAGANVNLPQLKTSATPLHCALLFGPKSYQGCVKKLLSAGANPLAEMYVPPEGVFGRPAFERFDAKMNSRWKEVMKLLGAIPLANICEQVSEIGRWPGLYWKEVTYLPPVADAYDLTEWEEVTSYLPRNSMITALAMAADDLTDDRGNTLYRALMEKTIEDCSSLGLFEGGVVA